LAHHHHLDVAGAEGGEGGCGALTGNWSNLAARGLRFSILLRTATTMNAAVPFWQTHGYRNEAVIEAYIWRIDALRDAQIPAADARSRQSISEKRIERLRFVLVDCRLTEISGKARRRT